MICCFVNYKLVLVTHLDLKLVHCAGWAFFSLWGQGPNFILFHITSWVLSLFINTIIIRWRIRIGKRQKLWTKHIQQVEKLESGLIYTKTCTFIYSFYITILVINLSSWFFYFIFFTFSHCYFAAARVHSSKRLVTLARGLSPAFLRFGGKRTDFLQFNNQKNLAKFRGPGPDYYLKNYEDGERTRHVSGFRSLSLQPAAQRKIWRLLFGVLV